MAVVVDKTEKVAVSSGMTRVNANVKRLTMPRRDPQTLEQQQDPPYTINLGVELIAITDVYPLKKNTPTGKIDTEYLEMILLKKSFFDKVLTHGENALISDSVSS